MAVVKGGAYGSGLLPVVEAAIEAGATVLAVATVSEGVCLRQADVNVPILVLGEFELFNVSWIDIGYFLIHMKIYQKGTFRSCVRY